MVSPVRFSIAVSVVCLFASLGRANLNLTPETAEYELDGVKLHQLVFHDGDQHITYTPPPGWQYRSSDHRFILQPPHGSGAEAVISLVKLAQPQTFDDATMKRLLDEVLASLPSSAKDVAVVSDVKNPLLIERKETFLVVVNYNLYGSPCATSVMFLNRQNEQVRFQLTCPRSSFPSLQRSFQTSHYSWQNL
jgi:hypothetical protein